MDFPKVYVGITWRINRLRFFLYSLLLGVVTSFIGYVLGFFLAPLIAAIIVAVLNAIFYLPLILKRFHDMNQNWIYAIPIYLVLIIAWVVFQIFPTVKAVYYVYIALVVLMLLVALTLLFTKWTVWPNKYGNDPLKKKS